MGTTAGGVRAQAPADCGLAVTATYSGAPANPKTPSARDLCGWGQEQRLLSRPEQLLQDNPLESKGAAGALKSCQVQGGAGEAPTERDTLLVLLPRLGWQAPGLG